MITPVILIAKCCFRRLYGFVAQIEDFLFAWSQYWAYAFSSLYLGFAVIHFLLRLPISNHHLFILITMKRLFPSYSSCYHRCCFAIFLSLLYLCWMNYSEGIVRSSPIHWKVLSKIQKVISIEQKKQVK